MIIIRNPNGHGSVYKLKGRRRRPWVARITTGWTSEGKQIRRIIGYFETKTEGMDALAMQRVNPVPPKADITLGELYQEWSDMKYKNISRSTENNYKATWLRIKDMENAKVKDLRTKHWQDIIDKCVAAKMSHSSLKKIKTVAVMLNNYAMQNDIINKNYAEFITLPKTEKKEKEIFSDIEIKTMFDNKDVPWVDTILIMIYSGMRISEMLQLTKFNVDLDNELITGGVKTEAGKNRIIPIHPKIMPFIRKWYDRNGETLICRDDGKRILTKYYREKKYYPALKQIEIRKLTPHACRHTFASLMSRAKVDPLYIQRIIGHTDYAFTANEYTHPEVKELKKAISMI